MKESKKKIKDDSQSNNSAKQRWQAHRILLEVGVSTRMAGKDFAAHVISDCYEKLRQEIRAQVIRSEAAPKVKQETGFDGKEIKDEPKDTPEVEVSDIEAKVRELLPFTEVDLVERPYAFAQNCFKKRIEQRRNLVVNAIGTCSRALSARQDLKIRRTLCGLPDEELVRDTAVIPVALPAEGEADMEVVKPQSSIELAFQMFKKATERVC